MSTNRLACGEAVASVSPECQRAKAAGFWLWCFPSPWKQASPESDKLVPAPLAPTRRARSSKCHWQAMSNLAQSYSFEGPGAPQKAAPHPSCFRCQRAYFEAPILIRKRHIPHSQPSLCNPRMPIKPWALTFLVVASWGILTLILPQAGHGLDKNGRGQGHHSHRLWARGTASMKCILKPFSPS